MSYFHKLAITKIVGTLTIATTLTEVEEVDRVCAEKYNVRVRYSVDQMSVGTVHSSTVGTYMRYEPLPVPSYGRYQYCDESQSQKQVDSLAVMKLREHLGNRSWVPIYILAV